MKKIPSGQETDGMSIDEVYGGIRRVTEIFYLFIGMVLLGFIAGIFILLSNGDHFQAVILAVGILPVILSLYLVYKEKLDWAVTFIGVILIMINTFLATKGLGIHTISNFAFPAILIIASLVINRRTMFILTSFTVLCIAWLVFGELMGLYAPTVLERSVPGDFFSASLIVILTAAMAHQITSSLMQSFSRLQKESRARKTVEDNLRQREAILEGITFAAEQFLKTPDWRSNISHVLERLGRTINADHAYLFEHFIGADEVEYSLLKYEWTADGHASDFDNPDYQVPKPINLDERSTDNDLRHGRLFVGNSSTFHPAERERLSSLGVKAMVEVPLFVDGKWWGTFGLDDLENVREWSQAEIDALKIAAGILSAAIQRQKAESAIQESERIYRQAIQAAGMVPYYQDYSEGRYRFVGEGIERMIGYAPEEVTPELLLAITKENIPLRDGKKLDIEDAIYRARSGRTKEWRSDLLVTARNGEERWLSDSAVELFGDAEMSYASVGILQDITDRKMTEFNLRKRESLLEAVTFSAEQFLKTPDWREGINVVLERLGREFNASHAYLFDRHPGPREGTVNSIRYEWTAPGQRSDLDDPAYQDLVEDEPEFVRYYEILNRGDPFVGGSSNLAEGERREFNKAGIKALLEIRIVVDGNQWGTIGLDDMVNEREWMPLEVDVIKVAANVLGAAIKRQLDEEALKTELIERRRAETALRFSEEKFSKAFHSAQVVMTIEDKDHRFVDVNKAFLDSFGFDRNTVIGRTASELEMFYSPEDAAALRQSLRENDGILRDYETRFQRGSGRTGFMLLSSEKINLENAEYILTSGLDITERKLAEIAIQQQAARAEVLASLSQLLTKVAQDRQQVFDSVVRRCAEVIGDGASVFLYSPEKEFLELVAVYNPDATAMEIFKDEVGKHPIKWNEGAYAKALGENQPVLIPFIPVDELIKRAPPLRRDYYKKLPIHSMMLAPLQAQGKVMGVIGMARHAPGRNYTPEDMVFLQDIADRSALAMLNAQYYRELEQELAERKHAEQKYRDIFNNSIDGIFQSTEDGRFLSVNPAMARIYGYDSPEDMLQNINDIGTQVYVNVEQRNEVLRRLNAGEKLNNYETLDYHKDGTAFWASMSAQAIRDEQGNILYYEGTVEDITPRKEAEAEREKLIRELADRNAESETLRETTSIVTSTLDVNEAVKRILEQLKQVVPYDSASVWLYEGKIARMVGLDGLPDVIKKDLSYPLSEAEPDYRFISEEVPYILIEDVQEHYPQFREPPIDYIHGWLSVALKARGKLVGFISLDSRQPGRFTERDARLALNYANQVAVALENARLFSDLQKELEGRKKLIADLEGKNAELEQFTYTVSHDLKSPLVTINGFLGYLEQDASSGNVERLKKDTQRIQEAVHKMQRLLNELLELSRIGRMMNAPEMIPFDGLARDALDVVHGRLEATGAVAHIQPGLPAVYGDRPRLVEVLQNLLDNAAKYMGDQKKPRIEIGQRGNENDMPVFYIKDNGMGIEPEHHERVFGLFNKLDAKSEGTGVGLALVKRIIEFHGGRIWIESEAGQGSTFLFTLPSKPKTDSVI